MKGLPKEQSTKRHAELSKTNRFQDYMFHKELFLTVETETMR